MVRRLTAKQWLAVGAGLVAAAVLIDLQLWRWMPSIWATLTDHAVLVLLGLPGLAVLGTAAVALRRARRGNVEPAATADSWPWLLSYPGVLTVATVVAAIGVAALVVMLELAADLAGVERTKLQVDAIKYGLGIFAAAGAAAALLLGVRRQRHTEHAQRQIEKAQAHTELDAAERRVTDLYTKAVEQLGHADAAVRLGGLYALERVAQNNVRQRQTIVDVLCAYLRMPYTPPTDSTADQPKDIEPLTALPLQQANTAPEGGRDARQELQVRLTAQRIISTHLKLPTDVKRKQDHLLKADPQQPFWPGINLDLTGATLIDWNLFNCQIRAASFVRAIFTGDARFDEATFTRDAGFIGVTFTRDAWFGGAIFTGNAQFDEATFTGDARFREAIFTGDARFGGATFTRDAWFHDAAFTGDARFGGATFTRDAWFDEATFTGNAWFDKAIFTGDARFDEATFTRDAAFNGATFTGDARFDEATFTRDAAFIGATFTGDGWFGAAAFSKRPALGTSMVVSRGDRNGLWPDGWRLEPDTDGMGKLVYQEPAGPTP